MENHGEVAADEAEYVIPHFLVQILKGPYWYMINEFIQMIRQDKQVFNLKKFTKAKKEAENYSSQSSKGFSKWKYICDSISNLSEGNLSYLILKVVYNKCLLLINEIKMKARKLKINPDRLIQTAQTKLEKYIYENNVSHLYSKSELIHLTINLKAVFNEKFSIAKPSGISNRKNSKSKFVSQFARSSFFSGFAKGEEEAKILADKRNKAIDSIIKEENSLNFIFGGLNNYFRKNSILLEDNSKLLEGRMFKIYCIDSKFKIVSHGLADINCERLGDVLEKRNSYYFPSDNEKFRKKMFGKLSQSASKSRTLCADAIDDIKTKFQPKSYLKSLANATLNSEVSESDSKISNIRLDTARSGIAKPKKVVVSSLKHNTIGAFTKMSLDRKLNLMNSDKSLNAIPSSHPPKTDENIGTKKTNFTFFNTYEAIKEDREDNSNSSERMPRKQDNNKLESKSQKMFDLFNIAQNSSRYFSKKERLIQDIAVLDHKRMDGIEGVKKKLIKFNKNYISLNKRDKSEQMAEVTAVLKSLKQKREFIDQSHKQMIDLIKKGHQK